jgi:hypothetical protein
MSLYHARNLDLSLESDRVLLLAGLLTTKWNAFGFNLSAEEATEVANLFVAFDKNQPAEPEVKTFDFARSDGTAKYRFTYKRSPALGLDVLEVQASL